MSSIATLLKQGQKKLAGSESPQIDAQVLLCHVLDIDRSYLYKSPEEIISDQKQKQFFDLIEKRVAGIPVSHLTGHREFWSLDLLVDRNTLVPRPETEHLVELANSLITKHSIKTIADLGTGSGAIALSIAAENPDCEILATDISAEALEITTENIIQLQLKNIKLQHGRWCDALGNSRFDLVVSNPPYIADNHPCLKQGDVQHEPLLALTSGSDGLDAIREIIQTIPDHINTSGWLVLEHGYDQKQAVQQLLDRNGFRAIETLQDYANLDRVTFGQQS
ncbi:MAG: peptide chain release factor N(5)-glutamine methyltransferase [Gammaproteobacteria bacterium]